MKNKKKILILILVSFIMIGVGYFISEELKIDINCNKYLNSNESEIKYGVKPACVILRDFFDDIDEYVGIPLFLFSISLFIISLIFLFITREQVFKSWSKFAKIYLPIAAILIFITPDSTGSIFLDLDKEMATWFLAAIFLISSLGIIIYKSFKKQ